MSEGHAAGIVAVVAMVTAALRFLPFLIFGEKRKTPPMIGYLSRILPYAVMGMLVVYCLKDVSLTTAPFGLPEVIGCLVVAAVHIWKRNTLLSISAGTACYMLMVQFLF